MFPLPSLPLCCPPYVCIRLMGLTLCTAAFDACTMCLGRGRASVARGTRAGDGGGQPHASPRQRRQPRGGWDDRRLRQRCRPSATQAARELLRSSSGVSPSTVRVPPSAAADAGSSFVTIGAPCPSPEVERALRQRYYELLAAGRLRMLEGQWIAMSTDGRVLFFAEDRQTVYRFLMDESVSTLQHTLVQFVSHAPLAAPNSGHGEGDEDKKTI